MKQTKKYLIIAQILLFIALLIFFIELCPLVIYNFDDWLYISQMRIPLPIWKGWNPTRVLPESFMPFCGWIAAHFIYPITGDYLKAITISCAIALCLFVVMLCICVKHFFTHRLGCSDKLALCYEVLFLILCFAVFRTRATSRYLFQSESLNCVFFYTMSGIINTATILVMMSYSDFNASFKKWSVSKKSLFIILVYFSIFSNIFHSGILLVYCVVNVLIDVLAKIKAKQFKIKKIISGNIISVVIITIWFVAFVFELSGGRADKVDGGEFYLKTSIQQLIAITQAVAKPFVVACIVFCGYVIVCLAYSAIRKRELAAISLPVKNTFLRIMINIIIYTIYMVILCSKVPYLSRIDASIGIWLEIIVLLLISVSAVIMNYPRIKRALPILVGLVFLCTLYPDGKFLNSTSGNTSYETCINTDEYIISKITEADKEGLTSIEIAMPDYSDQSYYLMVSESLGQAVSNALYTHGLINNEIEVKGVLDSQMNKKLEILR